MDDPFRVPSFHMLSPALYITDMIHIAKHILELHELLRLGRKPNLKWQGRKGPSEMPPPSEEVLFQSNRCMMVEKKNQSPLVGENTVLQVLFGGETTHHQIIGRCYFPNISKLILKTKLWVFF